MVLILRMYYYFVVMMRKEKNKKLMWLANEQSNKLAVVGDAVDEPQVGWLRLFAS